MTAGWMVRAGKDGVHIDTFLDEGLVWVGIAEGLEKVPPNIRKPQLVALIKAKYPCWKDGSIEVRASVFVRFCNELKVGHAVCTTNPETRTYFLGRIESGVGEPRARDGQWLYPRKVTWSKRVLREWVQLPTRNSLGSLGTLTKIKNDALRDLAENGVPIDALKSIVADAARSDPKPRTKESPEEEACPSRRT